MGVAGGAPRVDALHVGRGHAHRALDRVPCHLECGVAENGAVELGLEVELGEAVRRFQFAQHLFGRAGASSASGGIAVARLDLDGGAFEQVAGDFFDQRLCIVEGQPPLMATRGTRPLHALVEGEGLAVATQAVFVHAAKHDRQRQLRQRGRAADEERRGHGTISGQVVRRPWQGACERSKGRLALRREWTGFALSGRSHLAFGGGSGVNPLPSFKAVMIPGGSLPRASPTPCYTQTMVRVTIDLPQKVYEALAARAQAADLSAEALLADMTAEQLAPDQVSDEFKALTREIIATYRPVLDRLAE